MKILIVGSRGFIGTHLAVALSRLGGIFFSRVPTDGDSNFEEMLRTVLPDICVNCSGAAHVPNSFANPLYDFSRNAVDVYKMLEAIHRCSPMTKFLHLSSAAVYGNPDRLPVREDAPLNPLSPYGYHKMAAETFCGEFSRIFGVRTVSLRIFSAYGVGLRKQLFWDTYCKWRDYPQIKLFGTGEETRDFIFIDDLCEAVCAIIRNAKFSGERINVASGRSVCISDAVRLLAEGLGGGKEVIFEGQKREGDPDRWLADVSALAELGFVARVGIEEGIRVTAKWLKEQQS
jgi:dTDP-glucose 4,6-dehydratase/UDP-glucose 4-epimerase